VLAVDDHEVVPRTSGGELARRCAMAAVVGGGLGLVWLAVMHTASFDDAVSAAELGGLVIMYLGLPAAALLAWPLLWTVQVRKAWRVALLAPVPVVMTWHLLDLFWMDALLLVTLTAGGYAAAALVTAPGVRLGWWRPAVSVALAAMAVLGVVLSGPLRSWQAHNQLEHELLAYGHPLYAPDLPGFRVVNAGTSTMLGDGLTFYYQFWSADTYGRGVEIGADQTTLPAGFDPPTDCRAALAVRSDGPVPCVFVAPDVWSVPQTGDNRLLVVRRGDQIIRLTSTPDTDLLKIVTSLREQPPSYFF
jgi:hypothetical protein